MDGWAVENGEGDVNVNATGLYIDGEYLPDKEGADHA